ncbi:S-layer homology domain-containing protein [Pelotomaculum propionicicum]|uniref:SLH domain-containing protein n=1 Tax=Pelotomaculum propionicicum TaxID=258475 RepID=A0A4Y7RWR0_9FIRM|nr:S-layer homology domain-containing protein [Pelotomaculum propionicicum]TEB13424.1 hypothetical protein Pmgp_00318 [Pelotomaculum propionicicum]
MLKNKVLFPIILSVAVLLAAAGPFAAEAAGETLLDINGHWAQQYIAEMCASEIVTGYPGGLYQPDQSVTRLELLASLVRVLGQDEQAKNLARETVDYYVPPPDWGRGYLIWGVQRGMLDKNLLEQMAGPATRAEVAALVCGALQISPGSGEPDFEDAGQIAPGYRGLVSAVVDRKIMQGFPGNVFKPDDEITRAQMAVILSRIIDNNFAGAEIQFQRYRGAVSSIDFTNQLITLKMGDYGYLNKILDDDCEIYLKEKNARLTDLELGDEVTIVLNNNERVVFIKNTAQQNGTESGTDYHNYAGRVDSLTYSEGEYSLHLTDFDGRQMVFPVAAAVTINQDGYTKEIYSVNQNDFVEVRIAESRITEINFLDTTKFEGTVTSINSSKLTVRNDDGEKETWQVPGNVVVEGSTEEYEDIENGSLVEVKVYDGKAIIIEVIEESSPEGEVDSLDTSGTWGITIIKDNGSSKKYAVDDDVVVRNNDGDVIDFEDLDTGKRVRLRLNSDDYVDLIKVIDEAGNGYVEGEIYSLDTSGAWGITITDEDGDRKKYDVVNDVTVKNSDGDSIDFEDLDTGYMVKLRLNSDGDVYRIEVIDESGSSVSGTVNNLKTGSSPWIKIEKSSGSIAKYYISNSAYYTRNGSSINLRSIVIGSEVEIRLNNGKVVKIIVTDDLNITLQGEITDINVSSKRIKIRQESGNSFSYYLANNADLENEDGDEIELEDLEEGWDVEIKLENGKIEKLERK